MIDNYLNQTTTLKTTTGINEYGESITTSSTINIRWEGKRKIVRNSQGKEVISEATIYTQAVVLPNDIVTWYSRDWTVLAVSDITDLEGDIQFREVNV